uniref:DDE Tnp4 domain-containing protein n=1 Tax=Brassica oleracea var. oleracea TaxID=109376 RepID=A0A0D3BTK1_BRAOL
MASSSSNNFEEIDERFDQIFDQQFENLLIHNDDLQEASKSKKKRVYIKRQREQGHLQLWNDYFSEDATYPSHMFGRRFRMNKPLFMRIVDRLSAEIPYFQQRRYATGRTFCSRNHNFFGDEYLRRPTPEDLQRLLDIGEIRGFPRMIGSIDCMHWEWKNCPTAWKGQYTRGSGKPTIVFEAVASQDLWIWHAFFGPPGATFIQSIPLPQGPKESLFATHQEAAHKDVERAFGILQARFAIVKIPALLWDKIKIGKIMRACIIMHNMIVEDERDG